MNAQLIFDGPQTGEVNMQIDADLLDQAVQGVAALRFYQWSAPTISLGHFQAHQAAGVPARFSELACVKRLSGGGAILHHHELTYSCALPKSHPVHLNPSQLYNQVHEVIVEVLDGHGVTCQLRGDAAFEDNSFLCFSRGDERDIVIGQHKVVGSAQRRRQGAVLQHGSILLRQSEFAPEFPGIAELTGVDLQPVLLLDELAPRIAAKLGLSTSITQSSLSKR